MSFNYSYDQQQVQPQSQQTSQPQYRSSSQLWMGELDPWWDESIIKQIWNSFGFAQVSIKLIKERFQQGYNAGYSFIEFPTIDEASRALSLNGTKIINTNRILKLNWASGNNANSTGQQSSSNFSKGNELSIFVGDLSPDVTESSLFEFFGLKYNSVSGAKIMTDNVTGLSKGYGFVRFINEVDQQRALVEMQGIIFNGRPIRVSTAAPKHKPQLNSNSTSSSSFQSISHQQQQRLPQPTSSQGLNHQQSQLLQSLDSQYQPPLTQFTDPNNTTVFIGGLPSIITEDDLRLYFQPFGQITYVKIPVGKGCGFVQYTTRASAELAIAKMQGFPLGNSRIRLSWGRSNSKPEEMDIIYGSLPTSQQNLLNLQGNVNYIQPTSNNNLIGFNSEISEAIDDQSRLNQLYLAARDGRLDTIDAASNGFLFNQ
ncbi:hypothetical protein WICMUC_003404 [Wickerhamomyces mucosus]|uniref:RRM domain-containing protein n=1 Tax=Wickerhamomyces mucosus TaxID=1378264 RepID=A0A9P8PLZ9_9ASCO|nr:hypothetical protein WICMUC_003404 [Wickerhamomyces mucosus]